MHIICVYVRCINTASILNTLINILKYCTDIEIWLSSDVYADCISLRKNLVRQQRVASEGL